LRPYSWTAILAVIANTVFAISLHFKVQFAPYLQRVKRHRNFRSNLEDVCNFCKKIVAKYKGQRPFFANKLIATLRFILLTKIKVSTM